MTELNSSMAQIIHTLLKNHSFSTGVVQANNSALDQRPTENLSPAPSPTHMYCS